MTGPSGSFFMSLYFSSILIVIYYHIRTYSKYASLNYKLYKWMVNVTLILIISDYFGRFDGNPDSIFPILNHTGNFILFTAYPVLPSLWIIYVHYQVHHNREGLRRIVWPITIIALANVIFVIAQRNIGWLYFIDDQNIYHRGPGFFLPVFITFGYLLWAFVIIISNRKAIDPRHFQALLLFPVPPAICIVLQLLIYGNSFMIGGVTISLLIVYLYIQNQGLNVDYLTGSFNRRRLEVYLQEKIRNSPCVETFAAIMLDLDNFKQINDTFGHDIGDKVLAEAVKLVSGNLRSQDFVARYGGDEFYIILNGVDNTKDLMTVVEKIQKCAMQYNETSSKPYQIQFSMGYAVYDRNSGMDMEAFLKYVDSLMYENKRSKNPVVSKSKAYADSNPK